MFIATTLGPAARCFLAQATVAACRLFAFADGLAVVLAKVLQQLRELAQMFDLWADTTGLKLKPRKCALAPLGKGGRLRRSGGWSTLPTFRGKAIVASAQYLGDV